MSEKEKQITEDLIKGMNTEELNLVAANLPDVVLWNELLRDMKPIAR